MLFIPLICFMQNGPTFMRPSPPYLRNRLLKNCKTAFIVCKCKRTTYVDQQMTLRYIVIFVPFILPQLGDVVLLTECCV